MKSYLVRQRLLLLASLAVALGALLGPARQTQAVGEASTRFGIFVPPSANSTRDPTLVVTAVGDPATVTITDNGSDGDTDDTVTNITLNTGQSYILYIQEGAVNDDAGGKADGDFFTVTSTTPVVVANLTVNTDWQHEFVPADNRRMAGTSFYLYRPFGADQTAARNELLNLIAYSDNTDITIIDITGTPKTTSGITTVVPDAQGTVIFRYTLQAGQDLQEVNRQKVKLDAGRTYHIIANKDVTMMFGALGKGQGSARDGGGYVPGKSGYSADKTFYFAIPYYLESERELRLVAYSEPANVTVRGWNTSTRAWDTIATYPLAPYGHAELVGSALGSGKYFFEVTSSATISVFETNWLETTDSSYQTADIATFISAEDGTGAGRYFLAYMGPPGLQPGGSVSLSHLYVSANQTANVTVYDADSYSEYIELYNPTAAAIDLAGWTLTNAEGHTITLPAGAVIDKGKTFLLEFNQKATNATASFVYGAEYARFRLANAGDTLTLRTADGSASDSVSYASDWGSGGIYKALERVNPSLPFTKANSRDSASKVNASSSNLGEYYGTPGSHSGTSANGSGVIINELLAGRYLRKYTIAPNGYADVQVTVAEWEGMNNGEPPRTASTNPENPYLTIVSDTPVSVMNSNWNDNWLTYGTGTLQPDPYVNHVADYYQRRAGESVTFTTYAKSVYGTLYNPVTQVNVPAGVGYTPGSYRTPAQLSGVTPSETANADGSWTISWNHGGLPLAPGDMYRFQVWGTIQGGLATDSTVRSVARVSGTDQGGANQFASQDSAVVQIGADEPTMLDEVVINEALPVPGCSDAEWIELYNRGASDIAIGGWELADEDGFVYRFPENTLIARDGYLVVYLSGGTSVANALFTGKEYAGALGDAEDQVALYRAGGRTAGNLVDFVQWGGARLLDAADDDVAVAEGQWPAGAVVAAPAASQSVGRGRASNDSDTAADWDATGGPDSSGAATPGSVNTSIPGVDVVAPAPVTALTAAGVSGSYGQVALSWQKPTNGDLAGVRIVRSSDTFPTSVGDGETVYSGLAQSYTDTVPAGEPVYYAAFAYDDAGNIACTDARAQARVVPPQRIHLAYEDLKGAGYVDWDMNDFVVTQDSMVQIGDAGVTQIETRFTAEARGACFDHAFGIAIDVTGLSDVLVERYDSAGALTDSALTRASGRVNVEVFPSTRAALPPPAQSCFSNTVAGTTPVAGASARVVVKPLDPAANPPELLEAAPFSPWLRVKETSSDIALLQAGALGNTQRVRDGLGPLAGRDIPVGLIFDQAWRWPMEMVPIWDAYPQYAPYMISGGLSSLAWHQAPTSGKVWGDKALADKLLAAAEGEAPAKSLTPTAAGWPQQTGAIVFASPLIMDVDGDGASELVSASQNGAVSIFRGDGARLPGWPQQAGGAVRSSPALGDIDGDGQRDLVVGADDGKLYAWHLSGAPVAGFPVQLGGPVKASAALANLDADPALEIVAHAGDAKLYLIDGSGAPLAGWPRQMGGLTDRYGETIIGSTPAVGDLDVDGQPEIVVGSTDGKVYAWRLDGRQFNPEWPKSTGDRVYASPLIIDLNRDGYRDIVAASGDGRVYAWRADGEPLPGFPARVRGAVVASPAAADLDRDGDLELVVATLRGQVYALHHDGSVVDGWPRRAPAAIYGSPAVGDLDGDGWMEVLAGSIDGGLYAWHADGIPMVDWPQRAADWLVAAPALGDLDSDGLVEVAAGAYDGKLYVWDAPGAYVAQNIAWGAFGGGPARSAFVTGDVPAVAPPPRSYTVIMPVVVR